MLGWTNAWQMDCCQPMKQQRTVLGRLSATSLHKVSRNSLGFESGNLPVTINDLRPAEPPAVGSTAARFLSGFNMLLYFRFYGVAKPAVSHVVNQSIRLHQRFPIRRALAVDRRPFDSAPDG